jgi:mannose-1-phosphate guanylyltransferase/mannose-6-phosphate isomerase
VNYGVIMAGGKGERFWPLSRADKPKQFLKLTSDRSMLEETIERVTPLIPTKNMRIVTGESMRSHIINSISYITDEQILTEPFGRNTCMAIGLASVHLQKSDPEAVMVVLSADHLIRPPEKLLGILRVACDIATKDDRLITIGIVPTRPETGFGYIKLGEPYPYQAGPDGQVCTVAQFTEKPKSAIAQEYYYSRQYLWNSGMFVWSARSIMNAISACQPEIGELLRQYGETIGTAKEQAARLDLYQRVTPISIDYAVLEKATNTLVVKADIVWDDVGSWNALERYKERDSENNVQIGDSVLLDTYETTVYNDCEGLIACIGLSDLVVVRSGDITLVAHKTKVGEVKDVLAKLSQDEKRRKYL